MKKVSFLASIIAAITILGAYTAAYAQRDMKDVTRNF